jgi:hypothetical protein
VSACHQGSEASQAATLVDSFLELLGASVDWLQEEPITMFVRLALLLSE